MTPGGHAGASIVAAYIVERCVFKFPTHTPLFYLVLMCAIGLAGALQMAVLFGVLTFGHLLLDSWGTDDGIMWLWPFDRRQFGLFPRDLHAGGAYGRRFYRRHVRCWRVMVPEVLFLLSGSLLAIRIMTIPG